MIPAIRATCLRSESSKRSTGVALRLQDGIAEPADEGHRRDAARLDLGIERGASSSAMLLRCSSSVVLGHDLVLVRPCQPSLTPDGSSGCLLRVDVDREARACVLARRGDGLDRRRGRRRSRSSASCERTTSWARWRAWRRNSGAGPRAGTPAADIDRSRTAFAAASSGPGSVGRADHPDQVSVRRVAEQPRGGSSSPARKPSASWRGRVAQRLGASGRAPARSRARRARRGRCGPRAGPPARRCAPRRGSRGSAAWRRRRAPPRASRRGSRGPWPPSGCPRARPPRRSSKRAQHRGHAGGGRDVGVEPEHRQRRHQLLELALELLGARAVARHGHRAAVGADARHRLAVAAVVARHLVARAVQHQRDVAVRALPHARRRCGTTGSSTSRAGSAARSPSRLAARRRRAPRACARAAARPRRAIPTSSTGGSPRPSTRVGSSIRS